LIDWFEINFYHLIPFALITISQDKQVMLLNHQPMERTILIIKIHITDDEVFYCNFSPSNESLFSRHLSKSKACSYT